MAEERVAALNAYNAKTADIRKEIVASQQQVRSDMQRVEELEAQLKGSGSGDWRQRAATSTAGVVAALGLYNGGLSAWKGLTFNNQADVINGSVQLGLAVVAAIVLSQTMSKSKEGGE
mmetsp:Transcript_9702/g.23414  ORF Transcript_9702/g.23414 Transcript_9702/m.23414 type:complete len:118 (+) Transcript_9702:30-383(+)